MSIRDLLSYRLSFLAGLNDRSGHAHMTETFGLTLGEWRVLGNIHDLAPLTLSDLGRAMFLDKGQLSRMVAALVERGWVRDTPSTTDRRTAALSLTVAGLRQHDRIVAYARERNAVLGGVLTGTERHQLDRILAKLATFIEAEHAGLGHGSARQAEQTAASVVTKVVPLTKKAAR